MAKVSTQDSSPRRTWIGWVAGTVVGALVVTLAVVSQGFDSRETPREDPSIWVERTAGQYARVNTETAEIDTVRSAESPSGIVQTPDLGLLLTQGFGRAWPIDPTAPRDVQNDSAANDAGADDVVGDEASTEAASTDEADTGEAEPDAANSQANNGGNSDSGDSDSGDSDTVASMRTPDGTRQVIAAGDFVLFVTQGAEAHVSRVQAPAAGITASGSQASLGAPKLLDPFAQERAKQQEAARAAATEEGAADEGAAETPEVANFLVSAAAIAENGLVALYSQADQAVRWFDAAEDRWRASASQVPADVTGADVQLALNGEKWVLFDPDSGNLWLQGRGDAVALDVMGVALLQASTSAEGDVFVADEGGLLRVDRDGQSERIVDANGVAAQPRYIAAGASTANPAETPVAAWVSAAEAKLWTPGAGELLLDLDEAVEDLSSPELEVRTNGSRALVVERGSGMMWTVPDGRLIPVEQWSLVDPPKQETGTVVTQDVTEQEPPVAVDDSFGVRAGEPTLLPVLLNDFDPNRKDVLTVVTEGLGEGLSEDFGAITPLSDGQAVLVQPSANAAGSTTFSYRVTDGVNVSQPATVTLSVVAPEVNSGPEWCAVEGCQRTWPSPELAPGGTLIMPILEGWVDPQGDPLMLAGASVVNSDDPVRALVTADGKLAVRHGDANAPAADTVVQVRVVDSHGAESERDLRVRVRTGAAIEFAAAAVTAKVGEPTIVRPLERVTGGSGSYKILDAVVQQGSATVTMNQGSGSIEVLADVPGNALIGVTVQDSVTEQETLGQVRVTAVESRGSLAVPPLRAFVRPLADSTIDVLAGIPGANSRALTVQAATVREGQLRADVVEHSRVRVSGSTADGQPGRIGSVDVMVTEGEVTGQGRLTVFQVADSGAGAIAVTDTATVRAGSVVDIPVLENDVAPPGERLVLHPQVSAPGVAGELAFASGSNVRYLAPDQPGNYTLSYTTYGASSPEQSDVGQVRVTVLAAGANRDPLPATVTVRVAPGERITANVPLSGVDPDGDRVRLVSVDSPQDSQLSTTIVSRTNSVQVEASPSAQRSTQIVNYTVRDSFGGAANGRLRIIVTEPDPGGGAPVVYSDYVRISHGAADPAVVRPLDNDIDPSGGTLQLLSVVPNVPGGEDSALYGPLLERLDLSAMRDGIVRISGGDDLGTVSFKYTVRSDKSKSTADGLIVVQVSERVGQQAPSVVDTVLSVRDRADFERVGVDVVTDRVRWAAGDASTLQLSLWGEGQRGYSVSGSRILGGYKAEGDLVVFRLAGTDVTGAEVETFGFLLVPPLDELRLSLKPGTSAISVEENKSIDVQVTDLLDLGPGDRIELEQSAFSVQRQQATCAATSTTTITYSSGREAPWSDSCTIRVKLVEQTTYTSLPIAISIVPDDPVVQLNPLTRTIAPGAGEAVELTDMVQWQGGREGKTEQLSWQVANNASSFELVQSGSQVQVQARADAVPGSQQAVTVSVSGAGDSTAQLTLRVGEAPVDAPKGGTVSLQCTVGSSCSTPLVGVGGEYDPFAGKSGGGLHLVSVDSAGCQFGTMQAAGNSVSVSWPGDRTPGGTCTASFTVKDAQNRTGTGQIELDALGVPRPPSSVVPTGATATSVTLTVTLNSQSAHPETSGVELLDDRGGVVATCAPSGGSASCTVQNPPIGKENGRVYFARAVNAVGASDQNRNASESTWAYEPPPAPTVVAEPVTNQWNTSTTEGKVKLSVSGADRANSFLLTTTGMEQTPIGRETTLTLAPGEHEFSVIPRDENLPPGYSGSSDGYAGTAAAVVAAAPILTDVVLQPVSGVDDAAEVLYSADPNYADAATMQLTFGIGTGGSPNCSSGNTTGEFAGLSKFKTYTGVICAKTSFGITTVVTNATWIGGNPPELTVTRGYKISGQVSDYGNVREYTTVGTGSSRPTVSGTVGGATVRYLFSTGGSTEGNLGSVPVGATVQVQQCLSGAGAEYCSNPVPVEATGHLSTRITWNGECVVDGGDYSSVFTTEGRPITDATFAKNGSWNVRVSFPDFNNTTFGNVICPPAPDPEPEPDPEPDPDPQPDPGGPETPPGGDG